MAKNRYVNTAFWDDEYTATLDPSERYMFLYFLTNSQTNIAGIYQIQLRRIAFDTGYDQEMVKKIIDRFSRDGKLYFEMGWVIVKNFVKHQSLNPKTAAAVANLFNSYPEWLRARLDDKKDELYVPLSPCLAKYGYAIDSLWYNSNPNSNLTQTQIKTPMGDDNKSYPQKRAAGSSYARSLAPRKGL
jgi:DNA-binding MarR family transcriptional regulator